MKNITIPAGSIIDFAASGTYCHETGDVIVFLDKIAYMRQTTTGHGLLRMVTGVDITVDKESYDKVVTAVS